MAVCGAVMVTGDLLVVGAFYEISSGMIECVSTIIVSC